VADLLDQADLRLQLSLDDLVHLAHLQGHRIRFGGARGGRASEEVMKTRR
jgi:hypothetical protein